MGLVLYACDVCNRTITRPQNAKGIEVANRCVITLGCRGRLYQQDILEDFIRGSPPEPVAGLEDWQQRRVLHDHEQLRQESVWTINHGLGTLPVVSAFVNINDELTEITPTDITIIDSDTLTLTFETAYSGQAQLVARSADPQLLQPTSTSIEQVSNFTQITANNELTIATRLDVVEPTLIQMELTYVTPNGEEFAIVYDIDDNPSNISPWVSANKVLIQGALYLVRSFSPTSLGNDLIMNGSTVYVSGINHNAQGGNAQPTDVITPLLSGQAFVLLADEPYQSVDRTSDTTVDLITFASRSATKQMLYNNGELLVTTNCLTKIHPPIRSL